MIVIERNVLKLEVVLFNLIISFLQFRNTLIQVLLVNFTAAWAVDRACRWLFGEGRIQKLWSNNMNKWNATRVFTDLFSICGRVWDGEISAHKLVKNLQYQHLTRHTRYHRIFSYIIIYHFATNEKCYVENFTFSYFSFLLHAASKSWY